MKKTLFFVMVLLLVFCLFGCKEEEEQINYSNDLLFKVTNTPIDMTEKYKEYTLNIEIYNDGKAVIYGSDFDTWYGNSEIPTFETEVEPEEIQTAKDMIKEKNIMNFPENIGNKDNIAGNEKYLYVYTDKGELKTGGVSPSNKRFLKVYEYIYRLVAEEVVTYTTNLEKLQKNEISMILARGLKVCNSEDQLLFDESDIEAFEKAEVIKEVEYATDTDILFEEAVDNVNKEKHYTIIIKLDKESTVKLEKDTKNCEKSPKNYNFYVDGNFEGIIVVDAPIYDGRLKLSIELNEKEANDIIEEWSERIVKKDEEK